MIEKTKHPPPDAIQVPQEIKFQGKPVREMTDHEIRTALGALEPRTVQSAEIALNNIAVILQNHANLIAMVNVMRFELDRRSKTLATLS